MAGRPTKYETAAELQKAIDEYFENCPDKKIVGTDGHLEIPIYTITGLAYHLGFESRQSFYDYEKREGFSYTIKRARLRIEIEYEKQLHFGQCTGAIFALKNFDWKDKTEHELSGQVGIHPMQKELEKLTTDGLIAIANKLTEPEPKRKKRAAKTGKDTARKS